MTLQTHFISVTKSYLHCWNQHQNWQAATTHPNMFCGQQISFLQFNYINHNVSDNQYQMFSSVVECSDSVGLTSSSKHQKEVFLLDWLLRA